MISVRGQDRSAQKSQVSKAPTGPLFHKSDNGNHKNHKDLLESNKLKLSKSPIETPAELPQASPLLVL